MSNEKPSCDSKHYQHLLVAMQHATKALAYSNQHFQTIRDLKYSQNLALAVLSMISADQVLNPDDLTLIDQKMQLNQAIYLNQEQIKKIEDMNDTP
jgi:hypothetical protein